MGFKGEFLSLGGGFPEQGHVDFLVPRLLSDLKNQPMTLTVTQCTYSVWVMSRGRRVTKLKSASKPELRPHSQQPTGHFPLDVLKQQLPNFSTFYYSSPLPQTFSKLEARQLFLSLLITHGMVFVLLTLSIGHLHTALLPDFGKCSGSSPHDLFPGLSPELPHWLPAHNFDLLGFLSTIVTRWAFANHKCYDIPRLCGHARLTQTPSMLQINK